MKKIFAIIINYKKKKNTLSLVKMLDKQNGRLQLTDIVIDNNSIDHINKHFQKITQRKIFIGLKENIGFAKAVNKGIRLALHKGAEYILLLNPGVKITNHLVEDLIKNKVDIVGPVIKYKKMGKPTYDLGGRVDWRWGRTKHEERIKEFRIKELTPNKIDYLSGCCLLIKSKVFEKIGLFDERFFMYFEDVDFCKRAKDAGFKISQDEKVVIEHTPSSYSYPNLKSNLLFILKYQKGFRLLSSLVYFCLLCGKVLLNEAAND